MPLVDKNSDWLLNRVIYQSDSNKINNSMKYFLAKGTSDKKYVYPFFNVIEKETGNKTSFSPVYLSDIENPAEVRAPKIITLISDEKGKKALDTISSSWFRINNVKNLAFLTSNSDTNFVQIQLERKSDGKKYKIPVKYFSKDLYSFNKMMLLNGRNDFYRVIWVRHPKNTFITEELMISEPFDFMRADTSSDKNLSKSNLINEQFIDLSGQEANITDNIGLMVYPNPVGEVLYAAASLPAGLYSYSRRQPYRIRYTLSNSIGDISLIQEAAPGDVIQFSTSELPSGAYFLRAEEFTKAQTKLMTTKTIIISH